MSRFAHLAEPLRSPHALVGYAEHLRGQSDVQVKLLHYSEQRQLDADALEAHLSSSGASQVSVLLLATASSSYLWFDAEHCPRNVELCAILRRFPELRVNFIVCPTTESARVAWQQHPPDLESVFGKFLPETGKVDLWTHFDPDVEIESQQICSLVCRSRNPSCSKPEDFSDLHQQQSGAVWKTVRSVHVLLVLLLVALVALVAFSWRKLERLEEEGRLVHARLEGLEMKDSSATNNISKLISTCHLHDKKLGELETSSKSHGNNISKLLFTFESQGKDMSELQSRAAELDEQIERIQSNQVLHDKKIGELDTSSESHAKSILELASTCESQDQKIGELAMSLASHANNASEFVSAVESPGKKPVGLSCKHGVDEEVRVWSNQSLAAMQRPNAPSPAEWLNVDGIGSALALAAPALPFLFLRYFFEPFGVNKQPDFEVAAFQSLQVSV